MKLEDLVLTSYGSGVVTVKVALLKELLHKVQQLQAVIDALECGDIFDACDLCRKYSEKTCDFKFEMKEQK